MHLKASVIVPVYNVEPYIKRCIDSILKQNYDNFELILVDDGSTDASGKICDEYQRKDGRVVVIHQENAGPGAARNAGIKKSTGDILFFADSDDYVDYRLLTNVLAAFEQSDADLIQFNGRTMHGTTAGGLFGYEIPKYIQDTDYLRRWFLLGEDAHAGKRAYRKRSFPELRFPARMTYEDLYINASCLLMAKSLLAVPDVLYF